MESSVLSGVMFKILTDKVKTEEISAQHTSDCAMLMRSCSDIESADVPTSIQKLVATIGKEEDWKIFSKMSVTEATEFLLSNTGNSGKLFKEFLLHHGHRSIKEFDLRTKPWGVDQSSLVNTLQGAFMNGPPAERKKEEVSVKEAVDQLATPLNAVSKTILTFVVKKARLAVGKRETAKSMLILGINVFREAYRKLADRMVYEGRIPDADLVFFFTHNELRHFLKTRSARLLAKVQRRQKVQDTLDKLKFNDLCTGMPIPIVEKTFDFSTREASFTLNATPACQGVVVGVARVIENISEANVIQPGDILITYATDIGWSPYFPILGGVVTEIGGVISHGAVVAREYGLPCLIAAERATKIFKSGDHVRLNGNNGTLQLLSQGQ